MIYRIPSISDTARARLSLSRAYRAFDATPKASPGFTRLHGGEKMECGTLMTDRCDRLRSTHVSAAPLLTVSDANQGLAQSKIQ